MLLEPSTIVLYVDNLAVSSKFYQDLLGIRPEEASPTFHTFTLSNGMNFALKVKHMIETPSEGKNGNNELAFTLDNNQKVDELFTEWQDKEINIILPPSIVPYGYTFVALDPDGNRLRVVSLRKS
ncbi:VOC family protein [Legionella drancourtii]|uniref:VOC domain-containing protein n=1 Tax=Legionella drancourtii LLAP12 TaxID=658187 RepID=G9ERY0_9GAMM|nr:VOC family protein [Legionella drancourtii]EHL29761.1 hypothetical protein LDG_8051 [Legionella drancourtii LLAP12]